MNKKSDLLIKKQYIRDLSFENPFSPKEVMAKDQPTVNFDIQLQLSNIINKDYELNLIIKSSVKHNKSIIYLLELQYAGIFEFNSFKKENERKSAIIRAANILFPFARSIITNITKDGGYNPLIIQPIDFEKIYRN